MKSLRIVTGFFLAAVLLVAGVLPAFAAGDCETIVLKSAQLYPVMTNNEWEDMSRTDRVAACQISKEDALKMSTADLLQYVLNYPFMIDIYAYSTFEMGFEHIFNEFEALSLLLDRDDYGEVLINTYASIPVESSHLARSSSYYQNIWDLGIIEILIAQPKMNEVLTRAEIADLATIADDKYVAKSAVLDIYSGSCASFAHALAENPNSAMAVAVSSPVQTPAGSDVAVL